MPELKNVPPAEVGETVQDFVVEGKTSVAATRQGDGLWTIVATNE